MCYSGGSHPATATRANKMVMMVCLFIFISVLFQPFLQSRQFVVEVVEALQLQIVADTTTVWSDGLVVGDAVEVEKFLHTGKAVVGEADVYLVGQPLIVLCMAERQGPQPIPQKSIRRYLPGYFSQRCRIRSAIRPSGRGDESSVCAILWA